MDRIEKAAARFFARTPTEREALVTRIAAEVASAQEDGMGMFEAYESTRKGRLDGWEVALDTLARLAGAVSDTDAHAAMVGALEEVVECAMRERASREVPAGLFVSCDMAEGDGLKAYTNSSLRRLFVSVNHANGRALAVALSKPTATELRDWLTQAIPHLP